jgi:hypothetical protein
MYTRFQDILIVTVNRTTTFRRLEFLCHQVELTVAPLNLNALITFGVRRSGLSLSIRSKRVRFA